MEKYLFTPPEGRGERSGPPIQDLWPSRPKHLYSLTLSSNYAKSLDSINAYNYVINNLPEGIFYYTLEKSKNNKYHIHGIMKFKYIFDHRRLMRSISVPSVGTSLPCQYDIHIRYDELDEDHYLNFQTYMQKQNKVIYSRASTPSVRSFESCIPIVKVRIYYGKGWI